MNYIYHIPCECGEFARKRKNGEPYEKSFVMRCPYCKIKETVKPSLFRKGVVLGGIINITVTKRANSKEEYYKYVEIKMKEREKQELLDLKKKIEKLEEMEYNSEI